MNFNFAILVDGKIMNTSNNDKLIPITQGRVKAIYLQKTNELTIAFHDKKSISISDKGTISNNSGDLVETEILLLNDSTTMVSGRSRNLQQYNIHVKQGYMLRTKLVSTESNIETPIEILDSFRVVICIEEVICAE